MYPAPRIDVPTSQDRLSIYSTASSRAASRVCLPYPDIRRRSPSPTPTASRPPSPFPAPHKPTPTLPPPAANHGRVSFTSDASSMTLTGRGGSISPDTENHFQGTVLGGPVTAEPEGLTASPAAKSTPDPTVWLAPAPVSFATNKRYKNRDTVDFSKLKGHEKIPIMNRIEPRPNCLGALGWQPHTHPEGSLYFSYKNYYTNVYLYDETNLKIIEKTVELITKEMEANGIPEDSTDIGLEVYVDEANDTLGCYYLCDRKSSEAFWLTETSEGFYTDAENVKILGREHLKLAAEAAYWDHVFMFPHGRDLGADTLDQLHSELAYYIIDKETSKTSTAPYSADDLMRFLAISKEIPMSRDNVSMARPEHMALLARIKASLIRERFIRYHGERYGQLDSDRSVYEADHTKHSAWFLCFSWLFFFMPQIYFDRLMKVWVDEKVNYQHWRKFIGELQEDWTASITPATVVLTTNVGFLAIQSVDQGGTAFPDRTAGQIVSYVSTVLSIGNIIACVILARQHRPSSHHFSEDAISYLSRRARTAGGLEKLAVIFSIPTAFFIWALLTFFISISWVCFHDTNIMTRIMSGVTIALSSMLLGGIVHNGDWSPPPEDANTLSNKMRRVRKLIKKAPVRAAKKLRSLSVDAAVRMGESWDKMRSSPSQSETVMRMRRMMSGRSARPMPYSPQSLRYDDGPQDKALAMDAMV